MSKKLKRPSELFWPQIGFQLLLASILLVIVNLVFGFGMANAQKLAADLTNGAAISDDCAGCHREDGMGYPEGIPRLAGQSAGYLERQLHQLRQSARERNDVVIDGETGMSGTSKMRSSARSFDGMDGFVMDLTDQDIADVAAYYTSLQCKSEEKAIAAAPVSVNRCKICHGEMGAKSTSSIPNLAAQSAVYISRQLKFFRATPKLKPALLDEETFRYSRIMHTNAKWLTADDIDGLSAYYASTACR